MLRLALVLLLLLPATASAQMPPPPPVIAGTGEDITDDESRGDGGPAMEARFHRVDGLDWADGSILVADEDDGRIRHITPSGSIRTNRDEGIDGPNAVVSTGWYPFVAFEPHAFVVADGDHETIEAWTVHFTPTGPSGWDTVTMMEDVVARDVEATGGGGFWVTDGSTVWHRTFTGFPVNRWEARPWLEDLDGARGVGDVRGGFLVATTGDCRIRRDTDSGTVVVAGNGVCGGRERTGHGDGGPATDAWLRFPHDVEATPDDGFVFIESERVRRVSPDGTLSTLYYTGFPGVPINPDFPPPAPTALDVTSDGDVLIGLERRVLRFDTNYAPPAATPTPTPTPTATAGATPSPLPPPPPPPTTSAAKKLTADLSKASYKVKRGKKVAFKFTAATAADYVIAIRRGKKLAKAFKGEAKAGANTVKRRIRLKPGRYAVSLTLKSAAGTARDKAKLRVARP